MDRTDGGAKALVEDRGEGRGGPGGAVDDDRHPIEAGACRLLEMRQVPFPAALELPDRTLLRRRRNGIFESRFDPVLVGIRQLHPVRAEELYAVVLGWVVRSGDDDARVGACVDG